MLTVVDELSRYPFPFPCQNMHTYTVIACLEQIFILTGMPAYIHSGKGALCMSQLKSYLSLKGTATSRTTPYHHIGNSQVERYNGITWKAKRLAARPRNLPVQQREATLSNAFNYLRS